MYIDDVDVLKEFNLDETDVNNNAGLCPRRRCWVCCDVFATNCKDICVIYIYICML